MKRTQILLTEEQYKLLKNISQEKNISIAEAVRECIVYFGASKSIISDDEKYKRTLKAAGKFGSGLKDLARNHDKYLDEDITK
jgi:hypothetical protein